MVIHRFASSRQIQLGEKMMKKILKIAALILALGLCLIGILAYQIILINRPTQGARVGRYPDPQKAVVVIDIQEDFTGSTARPPFPYKESQELITTVNRILEASSRTNTPIIYIRQELDGFWGKLLSNLFGGGTAIKGNPGTEIDSRVAMLSGTIFPKPRSDAFSNPDFAAFLVLHQINELYLIGLDAAGCLHKTALGALNRGYRVHIIIDSIALLEKDKWDDLLKTYQEEGINLLSSRDFIDNRM
jgi:nicotinamidase-related amidase